MIMLLNRAKIFPGVSANMKAKDKVKHLRSDYYCGVGLGAHMIYLSGCNFTLALLVMLATSLWRQSRCATKCHCSLASPLWAGQCCWIYPESQSGYLDPLLHKKVEIEIAKQLKMRRTR